MKREKTTLLIISTKSYVHHPEKASKVLHESGLYPLSEEKPEEIKGYGLFLTCDKVDVKDLEK